MCVRALLPTWLEDMEAAYAKIARRAATRTRLVWPALCPFPLLPLEDMYDAWCDGADDDDDDDTATIMSATTRDKRLHINTNRIVRVVSPAGLIISTTHLVHRLYIKFPLRFDALPYNG